MATLVTISNLYPDRSDSTEIRVDSPPTNYSPEQLLDWWSDVVFPHTGDGKGGYSVSVAVVHWSDVWRLIGEEFSWEG